MDRRSFILGTVATAGVAMAAEVMPSVPQRRSRPGWWTPGQRAEPTPGSGIQRAIDTSHRVLIGPGTTVRRSAAGGRGDGDLPRPRCPADQELLRFRGGAKRLHPESKVGQGRSGRVTKVHDVWIGGPGTLTAASPAERGNLIGLFGDRITLRDFTTDVWEGGRTPCWPGTMPGHRREDARWRWIDRQRGFRFQGGRGFIGTGLYCESGDDAFQFVPAGAPADPTYGMDIEDSVYVGCTGSSSHAKLVVIGLQYGAPPAIPTASCP